MSWFLDIITTMCAWLDKIVYGLIGSVYELLMRIADATFFNQDIFREFSTRIYSILGIFMLFRLTFSLITYTINPDDLSDKSKGVQNIIGRILITLILLIITPTIFTRARELQKIILDNSVLENIILGIGSSGSDNIADPNNTAGIGNSKNTAGTRLSFVLLSTFLRPDETLFPGCKSGMYQSDGISQACLNDLNGTDTTGEKAKVGDAYISEYISAAWNNRDVSILLDLDLLKATNKEGQKYMNYQYLISTLAGGFVVYILVIFCIDIAVRSVKLGFLELIAPIPILGNIDPKASKDSTFSKWIKTVLNTYLDLFLRLASIYFAVFIFDNIDLMTGTSGSAVSDAFVKIFIILGALLFAKQLPDILKEFFPNMGKGTFDLSWRKKMEGVPIAGKALGALPAGIALGAGAGIGAGAVNFGRNIAETASNWKDGDTKSRLSAIGRTAMSGLTSGASGLRRGISAGIGGKKAGEIYKGAYGGATQARNKYAESREAGATMLGTAAARAQGALNLSNAYQKIEKQTKDYESVGKKADALFDLAGKEMIKQNGMRFIDSDNLEATMGEFKQTKARYEALKLVDTSAMGAERRNQHFSELTNLETYVNKTEKLAKQAFVSQVSSGAFGADFDPNTKAQIDAQVENFRQTSIDSSDPLIKGFNFDDGLVDGKNLGERIKAAADRANAEKITLENAKQTEIAKANAEAAKGSGSSSGGSSSGGAKKK